MGEEWGKISRTRARGIVKHKLSAHGIEFENEHGRRGKWIEVTLKSKTLRLLPISLSFLLFFLLLFLLQLSHEPLYLLVFCSTGDSELNKRARNSALESVLVICWIARHNLDSYGRKDLYLRKCLIIVACRQVCGGLFLITDWWVCMWGVHCGWYRPWARGPGLYKRTLRKPQNNFFSSPTLFSST